MLKKSFISKLEIINTVASVGIANITCVRIAMASPMQSGAELLLPCYWAFLWLKFNSGQHLTLSFLSLFCIFKSFICDRAIFILLGSPIFGKS